MFSDKMVLFRYDIRSDRLEEVARPFPAMEYFFGNEGTIYFSTLDPHTGDLVLKCWVDGTIEDVEILDPEAAVLRVGGGAVKEKPFYTFPHRSNGPGSTCSVIKAYPSEG